jgi:hypothetical protein
MRVEAWTGDNLFSGLIFLSTTRALARKRSPGLPVRQDAAFIAMISCIPGKNNIVFNEAISAFDQVCHGPADRLAKNAPQALTKKHLLQIAGAI